MGGFIIVIGAVLIGGGISGCIALRSAHGGLTLAAIGFLVVVLGLLKTMTSTPAEDRIKAASPQDIGLSLSIVSLLVMAGLYAVDPALLTSTPSVKMPNLNPAAMLDKMKKDGSLSEQVKPLAVAIATKGLDAAETLEIAEQVFLHEHEALELSTALKASVHQYAVLPGKDHVIVADTQTRKVLEIEYRNLKTGARIAIAHNGNPELALKEKEKRMVSVLP